MILHFVAVVVSNPEFSRVHLQNSVSIRLPCLIFRLSQILYYGNFPIKRLLLQLMFERIQKKC
ncbi:MAG TPA: hypothetical protein DDZ36_02815 [Deltaproteobacteria bacterium]|nr:hypothetical protein [Deltaproteobacteria bacterium]